MAIIRNIDYFPMGEPKSWVHGLGAARYARQFNLDGRVESHRLGGKTRVLGWDLAGRIESIVDDDRALASWSFGFDDADRLVSADNSAASGPTALLQYDWTYDKTGNRTAQTRREGANAPAVTGFGIASDSNRLLSVSQTSQHARTYDLVGNTIGWRAGGGTFAGSEFTATYSGRNRLVRIDRAGPARVARYAYNAFGERVGKWTGADASLAGAPTTRQFAYDEAGRLIGEYTGTGEAIAEHVWLGNTPILVLVSPGSGALGQNVPARGPNPSIDAFFVHSDHLDTPRAVLNVNGDLVWRWESTPFGETAPDEQPSAGLPRFAYSLRFPGQQYDAETGQHHNVYRDYEPSSGLYVQSDPIGLSGGLATYAYVEQQVLTSTDPEGLRGGGRGKGGRSGRRGNCQGCSADNPVDIDVPYNPDWEDAIEHATDVEDGRVSKPYQIDRGGAKTRRRDRLRGCGCKPGYDNDEWPMAFLDPDGRRPSIRSIVRRANRGLGSAIGNRCRGLKNGTWVRFIFGGKGR